MVADNTHSRVVSGAKVILPVAALIMLSLLFLLARTVNPDDAIPFADVDVSERAREQQLTAPNFTGVSRDGTEFALNASLAKPDLTDPRIMSAETVNLVLRDLNGSRAVIDALEGEIDTGRRQISLRGDVQIRTSTGYIVTAPRIDGSLGTLNIHATGGVEGSGPLGNVTADELHLNEDEDTGQRLVFTGGVNLLYTPPAD